MSGEQLYDEFGNYIGPELDDDSDVGEEGGYEGAEGAFDEDEEDDAEAQWDQQHGLDRDAQHTAVDEERQQPPSDDTRMITAADAAAQQQIILHEDKKYYPSAEEVYGADAEIVVGEEDTQALETPLIATGKGRVFAHQEATIPPTTFNYAYAAGLMDHPAFLRHVAIAGHLHHGKTSLLDLLVHQTHPTVVRTTKDTDRTVRYLDTRFDEQERGISIKMAPMSFVLPDLRGKSLLINAIDTPGHVNFSDEQTAAYRLADAVVLVVDAVEGVMLATERAVRHAVQEQLPVMLVINKVDRLILELKLPPQDAYHKLVHTIDEVNAILEKLNYFAAPTAAAMASSAASASAGAAASPAAAAAAAAAPAARPRLNPAANNVCFASALHGWIFSCASFGKVYAEYHGNFEAEPFARRLWGNMFLHSDRKFRPRPENSANQRTFIQFILEPLYKIYSYVLGSEGDELAAVLYEQLGIKLKAEQLRLDSKPLLRLVCTNFFGDCSALVSMLREHCPDPVQAAAAKVRHTYTGSLAANSALGSSLLSCDAKGPLLFHSAKNIARVDGSAFDNFGRVLSGTLRVGDQVRVLGEGYSLDDEEDSSLRTVTRIWMLQGRYRVEVNRVVAGNLALVEGLDEGITKTATVVAPKELDPRAADACIVRPLRFQSVSVFKVALEPINPSELPRMLEGLRRIDRSFPLAQTRVEESGEHVLLGTGELYMDVMLHDLRRVFGYGGVGVGQASASGSAAAGTAAANALGEIEIKISDPQVRFCETVLETSSLRAEAQTPNKHNTLAMVAEPLDAGIADDIETGAIPTQDPKARAAFFQQRYQWDILSARSIWSFGPDSEQGPNMLVDHTLPSEVDRKSLAAIRDSVVQGFQWGTREGPLCDEPIRNVKFKLLHANVSNDPLQRARGQVIPTARRACYSSFLLASPRLMEPVYFVEIQAPADCVSAIYNVLARRRGHVTASVPKAATPLYTVHAYIPLIESFGFETDLRTHTQGLAFCLSVFDHFEVVPGDPLDKSIVLRPLEPAPIDALAREFMLKTRRRKGLNEDVQVTKFFDEAMVEAMAKMEIGNGRME